jgi:hypothetical protein
VHVCATKDYVVLLDTRRNKFLGLSGIRMSALAEQLERGCGPLLEQMQTQGLLTTSASATGTKDIERVHDSIYEGFVPFLARVRAQHVTSAMLAYMSARRTMRTGDIESHAARVTLRTQARRHTRALTLDYLQDLIAAYTHCRAWIYTASGSCLLDSIAVHDFLSRYGVSSSLVVGVKTTPFAAHAWVQFGTYVVNDRADIVRGYEPIYCSD